MIRIWQERPSTLEDLGARLALLSAAETERMESVLMAAAHNCPVGWTSR